MGLKDIVIGRSEPKKAREGRNHERLRTKNSDSSSDLLGAGENEESNQTQSLRPTREIKNMENVQDAWTDGVPAEKSLTRGSDDGALLPNHKISIPMMREKFLSQSHLPVYNSKAPSNLKRSHVDAQRRMDERRGSRSGAEGEGLGRANVSIGREHAVIKPNKRRSKAGNGERSRSVKRESNSSAG